MPSSIAVDLGSEEERYKQYIKARSLEFHTSFSKENGPRVYPKQQITTHEVQHHLAALQYLRAKLACTKAGTKKARQI